jgi:hypothetical protein
MMELRIIAAVDTHATCVNPRSAKEFQFSAPGAGEASPGLAIKQEPTAGRVDSSHPPLFCPLLALYWAHFSSTSLN